MTVTVNVRASANDRFSVTAPSIDTSIAELKELIGASSGTASTEQRLIYKGRVLTDTGTLASYGFKDDETIHMVRGAVRSQPTVQPVAAPAPAAAATPPPVAANPFANPFGGAGGMPGMTPNMADMQRQMQQNPDMMRQMMNNPMVEQMLNNPEALQAMMESNPQTRAMMEQNPQLREVLSNPEVMRQSMEMMRNPAAMQQAQRGNDLQMSQIENMPGGFQALANMYRNMQGPMESAMGPEAGATAANTSNQAAGGLADTPMVNPWATQAPAAPASAPAGEAAAANPFAGMGGLGATPGMPQMPGMPGMPPMDANGLSAMLDNPMMRGMMDQMAQNPAMMQNMMQSNPMLQQMAANNPQMQSMLNNPAAMAQMMNPDNMRSMLNMQQSMDGGAGVFPPMMGFPPSAAAPAPAASTTVNGMDFSNLINQFQAGANVTQSATPVAQLTQLPQLPPEVRFATQLSSMNDMGFTDRAANIAALTATNGNVNRAVERLLG